MPSTMSLTCPTWPIRWELVAQCVVGFLRVHGRLDYARRYGVYANASRGILDGQSPGDGSDTTLGERSQGRRCFGAGVVDERGRDVDNMARTVFQHLDNDPLRQKEKPGEVDANNSGIVITRIVGERLGNEYTCIIY